MRVKIKLSLCIYLIFQLGCYSQGSSEVYLNQYGIVKDSIQELTFKNKESFQSFVKVFEDKKGFELPKFLIYDSTGQLLKHRLDVLISACGKGDVNNLPKKYHKNLPTLDNLSPFFKEAIAFSKTADFVVIFIWHEVADKYNKHTFETYHTWKENDNIDFYFVNMIVQ